MAMRMTVSKLLEVEVQVDGGADLTPEAAEQAALETVGEGWLVTNYERHNYNAVTVLLAQDMDWAPF